MDRAIAAAGEDDRSLSPGFGKRLGAVRMRIGLRASPDNKQLQPGSVEQTFDPWQHCGKKSGAARHRIDDEQRDARWVEPQSLR
jgi:hypothetical protein